MEDGFRIGIVGLGLIGGSLAKALRESAPGVEIYASDRRKKRVEMALGEGVISGTLGKKNLPEMDIVVLAVPVQESVKVARDLILRMAPESILTDCGSVKGEIYRALQDYWKSPCFVAGHPIAGTERSGYENGFPTLFRNRMVFLCPYKRTPRGKVALVKKMWERVGARVRTMDPDAHDHLFAFVSHLPHAVAYSLVHAIATFDSPLPIGYSAGGFRDFTRIASSDPTMWTEIMLQNREEVLRALRHFRKSLGALEEMIKKGDEEAMKRYFRMAKKTRDSLPGV
ncbi:MAG: prephenate dehydrogenase [Deltaproteobacteria bacterium]|nr:MAG: prephenate dehydrogenase [Deltaproteobacteria bacterium]